MRNFILWDGSKEVSAIGTPYIEKLPSAATGQKWVEITDDIFTHTCDASGATIPRPIPLNVAQATAWTAAKAYRAKVQGGSCASPLGRIQCDTNSQKLIGQKAQSARSWVMQNQMAAAGIKITVSPASWSVSWRMLDNSLKNHSASDFVALHDALIAHNAACQSASDAIRTKIFAATDSAAVASIDVTAGYPI